jgi:hypothetical protein
MATQRGSLPASKPAQEAQDIDLFCTRTGLVQEPSWEFKEVGPGANPGATIPSMKSFEQGWKVLECLLSKCEAVSSNPSITQEAEIRKIVVLSQPGQIDRETLS